MWTTLAILTLLVIGGALYYFHRAHQTISDDTIVKNVKAKLYDDVNLRKCTIDVRADKGVVTLAGSVHTDSDNTSAVSITKQVQGAKQVLDQLVVQTAEVSAPPATEPPPPSPAPQQASPRQSKTIEVPGYQGWTPTGIRLSVGDSVEISASGAVTMSVGWAPTPPAGVPPNCGARGGFPAGQLPCWSLIGRIGEQGAIFYVGSSITFRAPISGELFLGVNDDILGDNRGSWTAAVNVQRPAGASSSSPAATSDPPSANGPRIIQAIIRPGATFLQLLPGRIYLHAMVARGGLPSTLLDFSHIPECCAYDRAGNLVADVVYATSDNLRQNGYTTETRDHIIGGVSISGGWDDFDFFRGEGPRPDVTTAPNYAVTSADFQVKKQNSLVVIVVLGSDVREADVSGVPGLQMDASSKSGALTMMIAHAYLQPGNYTVTDMSFAVNYGDPSTTVNLVGALVVSPKG